MGTQSRCHGTGGGQDLAPCVVGILDNCSTAAVQDSGNVALNIGGIVVVRTVIGDGHGGTGCIVGKVQGIVAHSHLAQAAPVIDVVIGSGTVGPLGSQTVCVVGVRPSGAAIGHGSQLTAMLPGVGPGSVRQHIANGVTFNGIAIISGQQIAPCGVIGISDRIDDSTQSSGGIRILCAAGDIACVVICPDPSFARCLVVLQGQLVNGGIAIGSGIVFSLRYEWVSVLRINAIGYLSWKPIRQFPLLQ